MTRYGEEYKLSEELLDTIATYMDDDKRINFLLAKEAINMGYLQEIYKFCCDYTGDHADYFKRTAERIKQYLD